MCIMPWLLHEAGPCYTNFFSRAIQIQWIVCFASSWIHDHYKILHMPRQHSCRVMCKILQWLLYYNLDGNKISFSSNLNYSRRIVSVIRPWPMLLLEAALVYSWFCSKVSTLGRSWLVGCLMYCVTSIGVKYLLSNNKDCSDMLHFMAQSFNLLSCEYSREYRRLRFFPMPENINRKIIFLKTITIYGKGNNRLNSKCTLLIYKEYDIRILPALPLISPECFVGIWQVLSMCLHNILWTLVQFQYS